MHLKVFSEVQLDTLRVWSETFKLVDWNAPSTTPTALNVSRLHVVPVHSRGVGGQSFVVADSLVEHGYVQWEYM